MFSTIRYELLVNPQNPGDSQRLGDPSWLKKPLGSEMSSRKMAALRLEGISTSCGGTYREVLDKSFESIDPDDECLDESSAGGGGIDAVKMVPSAKRANVCPSA